MLRTACIFLTPQRPEWSIASMRKSGIAYPNGCLGTHSRHRGGSYHIAGAEQQCCD